MFNSIDSGSYWIWKLGWWKLFPVALIITPNILVLDPMLSWSLFSGQPSFIIIDFEFWIQFWILPLNSKVWTGCWFFLWVFEYRSSDYQIWSQIPAAMVANGKASLLMGYQTTSYFAEQRMPQGWSLCVKIRRWTEIIASLWPFVFLNLRLILTSPWCDWFVSEWCDNLHHMIKLEI